LDAAAHPVTVTRVRFPALDGYSLGGFLHVASDVRPTQAVVFATGGGIRAEVYKHFLNYLASHGMAVLVFDYRGIGESRPSKLRGFVAGFEDWAEYDAGGAIEWMSGRYPDACLTGMGHSIGGLLIGAPATSNLFNQLVLICPHTGYHGDYTLALRLAVYACWCILGPTTRTAFGYFPASLFAFGEDLPSRVSIQWGARREAMFAVGLKRGDTVRENRLLESAKALRLPTLVISADDDPWATETGVRRAIYFYRNLLVIRRTLTPTEGGRSIGHSGFFRRSQKELHWNPVVNFVQLQKPIAVLPQLEPVEAT
jgi:predicted alpha/beta hydrolase